MNEDDLAYYSERRARIAEAQKVRRRAHYLANKDLYKAKAKAWKAANQEKVRDAAKLKAREKRAEHPEKHKEANKRYRLKNPEAAAERTLAWAHARPGIYLYYNAKYRAKKEGIPFTIEKSDVVIPEFCPVLGIPIDPAKRGKGCLPNSPSLDKIIPELGYVPGNVRVISHRANSIKRDATADELYKVARWVESETTRVRSEIG